MFILVKMPAFKNIFYHATSFLLELNNIALIRLLREKLGQIATRPPVDIENSYKNADLVYFLKMLLLGHVICKNNIYVNNSAN